MRIVKSGEALTASRFEWRGVSFQVLGRCPLGNRFGQTARRPKPFAGGPHHSIQFAIATRTLPVCFPIREHSAELARRKSEPPT